MTNEVKQCITDNKIVAETKLEALQSLLAKQDPDSKLAKRINSEIDMLVEDIGVYEDYLSDDVTILNFVISWRKLK